MQGGRAVSIRDHFYESFDGLRLHARIYEAPDDGRLPVVCLAGLTRNARDFDGIARHLAQDDGRTVICFDYRGRGDSQHAADWKTYAVPIETDDILRGLASLGVDRAAFIGTSRGGLILHVIAAMRPEILAGVILNDIGPVIEPAGLALIVDYLGKGGSVALGSFEEAANHQRLVHGAMFPLLGDNDWMRVAHALYRRDGDRVVSDYDPALLNTLVDFDPVTPLPSLWAQFDAMRDIPVMVIRGEHSTLLSNRTTAEMAARHPALERISAAGQGHAPLLDVSDLPRQISRFISQIP